MLSLLLIACVGLAMTANRTAAVKDAGRELENLSRALAESTDRGFQYTEVVQDDIVDRIVTMGIATSGDIGKLGTRQFHDLLNEKIANSSYLDALTLIDPKGKLVNFSRDWPVPAVDVSDRDYYKALATQPGATVFIGEPVQNRGNGIWTIYLAKRIVGADHQLLGLILAAMKVSYFEKAYSSFAMPGGRVSLFRSNGNPLARFPHVEVEYQKSYGALPIFDGGAVTQHSGTIFINSLGDGTNSRRMLSFNRLDHYPLIMTVSKSMSAVLQDWEELLRIFVVVTIAMVVFIGLAVFVVLRSIKRAAKDAEQARLATENELIAQQAIIRHASRFKVAIDNMLHGVTMYDRDDRLIVCNKRYADMYDMPAALTQPGTSRHDMIAHAAARVGYQDVGVSDVLDNRRRAEAAGGHSMVARELRDGRTILVRSQILPENGWIVTHEDITDRRKTDDHLAHLARHDALTDLPNRLLLQERMQEAIARIGEGMRFAILCLDLDHFKEINDTLGHAVGDELLRQVALRLRGTVAASDTVARMGGDEFAIIQSPIEDPGDAIDLAERIVASLTKPYEVLGHIINIGASVGIAFAPRDGEIAARLLSKADIALYRAKLDGRRRHCLFEPEMEDQLQARRTLENDLRQALDNKEFEVFFQPLVDSLTKSIRSFEALVRWRHPVRGLVPPIEFIPLAEETGLIGPLGAWILDAACAEAALWPAPISVSVNISVCQFRFGDLVDIVSQTLARTRLEPRRLELEITESVLLNENDNNLDVLHALRALGVRIVMDDFGTGYSSLNYLRVFPFDKIKIDKSFIQNLDQNSANEIVRLISDLGKKLGMKTTAEGVETEAQLEQVLHLGCTELQGYLFSRPVPAGSVARMIEGQDNRQAA